MAIEHIRKDCSLTNEGAYTVGCSCGWQDAKTYDVWVSNAPWYSYHIALRRVKRALARAFQTHLDNLPTTAP